MPSRAASTSEPPPDLRPAVWIGPVVGTELALAAEALATLLPVVAVDDPRGLERVPSRPRLAILACHRPALWTVADLTRVATALPLVPLVAVTTSLAEGSRRNGESLPAIEEIPWLELPGRMWSWCHLPHAAGPGLPATSRRDERWLAQALPCPGADRRRILVAAPGHVRDPLCDLLVAAGWDPEPLGSARPPAGCRGPVVWDVGGIGADGREWLRLLTADGRRDILVMESFPRGDGVRATLAAGAAAVLPRVVSVECLAGTLGWMTERAGHSPAPLGSALGAGQGGR